MCGVCVCARTCVSTCGGVCLSFVCVCVAVKKVPDLILSKSCVCPELLARLPSQEDTNFAKHCKAVIRQHRTNKPSGLPAVTDSSSEWDGMTPAGRHMPRLCAGPYCTHVAALSSTSLNVMN